MALEESLKPNTPKEYWEDDKWLDENYMEIARQYPEMWVAIVNKQVVASGENLEEVIDKAKGIAGHEHFPVDFIESRVHVY